MTTPREQRHPAQEHYAIRVKGHLAPSWSEAFEGMQLQPTQGGETLITGPLVDQAALHGLLARIRDLNLTLISVTRINSDQPSLPRAGKAKR